MSTNTVRCNLTQCYWNKGSWCSRNSISLVNGMCGQLVNQNGSQRDPKFWQHPTFDDNYVDINENEEVLDG